LVSGSTNLLAHSELYFTQPTSGNHLGILNRNNHGLNIPLVTSSCQVLIDAVQVDILNSVLMLFSCFYHIILKQDK